MLLGGGAPPVVVVGVEREQVSTDGWVEPVLRTHVRPLLDLDLSRHPVLRTLSRRPPARRRAAQLGAQAAPLPDMAPAQGRVTTPPTCHGRAAGSWLRRTESYPLRTCEVAASPLARFITSSWASLYSAATDSDQVLAVVLSSLSRCS